MEDEGDTYFKILLSRCLFQDVVKDSRGRIISCKMHDLIRDIACDVSMDQKLQLDPRNLSDEELWTNRSKKIASKLRTIVCYEEMPHIIEKVIHHKIANFVCLRVLMMNSRSIYKLPDSIGKLKHLRYLDISGCLIQKLPESIVLLYNLQTPRVGSSPIENLPKNLRELVSLRHLEFSKIYFEDTKQMPPHLSQLVQLQTLSCFIVGFDKSCTIAELGPLKNLKGSLELSNLERVKSREEARTAKLMEKKNLRELVFKWNWCNERGDHNNHNDSQVLEGLEPHKNLQSLNIQSFLGECLPNKIFVENLVTIRLIDCQNCERLPMLGQLTNLEELHIVGLNNVQSIGNEFYGNDHSNQRTAIFPKLNIFKLIEMEKFKQWEEVTAASNITTFPRLETLEISKCPMLSNIPDVFGSCDENGVKHLEILHVSECSKLTQLPNGLQSCHSIQHLRLIDNCSYLTLNLPNNQMLSCLRIKLPEKLAHLTNLKEMDIFGCMMHHDLMHLRPVRPVIRLSLVDELRRVMVQLPQHHDHLVALQELSIQDFCGDDDVEALPEWLENLTSLQTLNLSFCVRMKNLSVQRDHVHVPNRIEYSKCFSMSTLETRRRQLEEGQAFPSSSSN